MKPDLGNKIKELGTINEIKGTGFTLVGDMSAHISKPPEGTEVTLVLNESLCNFLVNDNQPYMATLRFQKSISKVKNAFNSGCVNIGIQGLCETVRGLGGPKEFYTPIKAVIVDEETVKKIQEQ